MENMTLNSSLNYITLLLNQSDSKVDTTLIFSDITLEFSDWVNLETFSEITVEFCDITHRGAKFFKNMQIIS